jgi:hypothetical protein
MTRPLLGVNGYRRAGGGRQEEGPREASDARSRKRTAQSATARHPHCEAPAPSPKRSPGVARRRLREARAPPRSSRATLGEEEPPTCPRAYMREARCAPELSAAQARPAAVRARRSPTGQFAPNRRRRAIPGAQRGSLGRAPEIRAMPSAGDPSEGASPETRANTGNGAPSAPGAGGRAGAGAGDLSGERLRATAILTPRRGAGRLLQGGGRRSKDAPRAREAPRCPGVLRLHGASASHAASPGGKREG